MNCPACGSALCEKKKAGIVLDECEACKGIWFDRDELAQYHRQLTVPPRKGGARFTPREDLPRQSCPRCRVLTLSSGGADGERAFRCVNCRGIFLSRSALVSLGQVKAASVVEGVGGLDFVDGEILVDVLIEVVCAIVDW
jgi:Zn-finger nucleic acid-binding protein